MPSLDIKLDVDECGFDALSGMGTAADGIAAGKVIHLGNDACIEIGTLRAGTEAGRDSVAMCFTLPDGRVVLAETTAALFLGAAQVIAGWQEGRRARGEG